MSSQVFPMRTHDKKMYVDRYEEEKGRHLHCGTCELGSVDSEADLMRKIFRMYGPGKYSFKFMRPQITPLWTGWIFDRGDELLIKLQIDKKDGSFKRNIGKLDLDELDYSRRGKVSLSKIGGA